MERQDCSIITGKGLGVRGDGTKVPGVQGEGAGPLETQGKKGNTVWGPECKGPTGPPGLEEAGISEEVTQR